MLPTSVEIREVGPRDGLQAEAPVEPARRAELVRRLVEAGCSRVEVASFVSERAVPAMAGANDVVAAARELRDRQRFTMTALVPNLRGAEAALDAGVDELTVTVAASPTYNERNVRRTIDESVAEISRVVEAARRAEIPVDAVISCAFGSPYEQEISPAEVAALSGRLVELGAAAITLADTTGLATPQTVETVLEAHAERVATLTPGVHFHETRGTAMVNAYTALRLGVTRFDTSVGGLGGSPFAHGAGGNLATEDFVCLLDGLGIRTGIDLDGLCGAAEFAREIVGHDLASKVRVGTASAILME